MTNFEINQSIPGVLRGAMGSHEDGDDGEDTRKTIIKIFGSDLAAIGLFRLTVELKLVSDAKRFLGR